MKVVLLAVHLLIALGLITLILLQGSGGGLGSAFGGGELYRSKRGAERVVFIGTIVLAVLFFVTSLINVLLH